MCGFGLTWILILALMIGDLTDYRKTKVKGKIPEMFPVVVRVDDRARIVWWDSLTDYLKERPSYSFLIPENQTDIFKSQINSNTSANLASSDSDSESGKPWEAFFTVKTIAPGKQALKVYATWDDDIMNVGWYEATEKEVFPQHHTSYVGPGLGLIEVPTAVLIT